MFFVHPLLVLMKLALSIYKLTILDSTEIILHSKASRIHLYNEVTNHAATAVNLSSVCKQKKPNSKLLNRSEDDAAMYDNDSRRLT